MGEATGAGAVSGRKSLPQPVAVAEKPPAVGGRCKDYDEDCEDVPCKLSCWLYAPEEGVCPYLSGEPTSRPPLS